jgi:hypothetical protein
MQHAEHDGVVEQCLKLLANMARNPIVAARIVKGDGVCFVCALCAFWCVIFCA